MPRAALLRADFLEAGGVQRKSKLRAAAEPEAPKLEVDAAEVRARQLMRHLELGLAGERAAQGTAAARNSELFLQDCVNWPDGGKILITTSHVKDTRGYTFNELGEIAPGLIHQTGCNGAGAAASLAWGEETAGLVREVLARS